MSFQTTEAKGVLTGARSALVSHTAGCVQCASSRRDAQPCPVGIGLAEDWKAAKARVRREQEQDAAPCKGQGTLW